MFSQIMSHFRYSYLGVKFFLHNADSWEGVCFLYMLEPTIETQGYLIPLVVLGFCYPSYQVV